MSVVMARFLVFFSSASVLVMEILAGRLMAPYVGVSLETFTGIIGTMLAAIALGAWVGGRLADERNPRPLLAKAFTMGGILALVAPTVTALVGVALRGGGALAVVLLTGLAFFAPAAVLSAVSPLLVKLRLESLEETGEVVGSFSAVGTAGALAGTFVTGFVLMATLPTRPIVFGLGLTLVLIGFWLAWDQRRTAPNNGDTADGGGDEADPSIGHTLGGAGLAAVALLLVPGPCTWETTYSCANVVVDPDNPTGRTLQLDLLSHSYVDLNDPTNLEFRYLRDVVASIDATARPGSLNTLGIGGGGFTMPRYLAVTRPGTVNTVFEIDAALVDIATDELGLDLDAANLDVVVADARLALTRLDDGTGETSPGFDVVIGDAFAGISVPWHLTTVEFLQLLKESMTSDGVYVMNVIDFPEFRFLRSEIATLRDVFDNVVLVTLPSVLAGTDGANAVIVATDSAIDVAAIEANLTRLESESEIYHGAVLDDFVGEVRLLTDDFAPVDQMIDVPIQRG